MDDKHADERIRRRPEDAEAANQAIQQEHTGGVTPPVEDQDPTRRPPSPGTAGLIRGYAELAREHETETERDEELPPEAPKRRK